MASARTGIEGEEASGDLKGAERVLQRIVQPDQAVAVDADAGCVRSTTPAGRRIAEFDHGRVGPGYGGKWIDPTDRMDPPLRPPDMSIRGNGVEMGRQTCARGRSVPDLVLLQDPEIGVFTNQCH